MTLQVEQLPGQSRNEPLSALLKKVEAALAALQPPQAESIKTVLSNYSAQSSDVWIFADCTGGDVTILLPKSALSNHFLGVIRVDGSGNNVFVKVTPGDALESGTSATLAAQWNKNLFIPNGGTLWAKL